MELLTVKSLQILASRYAKNPLCVFLDMTRHFFHGNTFQLCEFFYHLHHIRGLVPFSTIRRGRHIWCIGFGKRLFYRDCLDYFVIVTRKSDDAAERERKTEREKVSRFFRIAGEKMDDTGIVGVE